MNIKLPLVVQSYVQASNAHDVPSILACFADDAVVRDEGETLQGKKAIEAWIVKTIGKYKFHFEPLNIKEGNKEVVVAVKVSGTFDGSPVTLNYHFAIESGKISSFAVK